MQNLWFILIVVYVIFGALRETIRKYSIGRTSILLFLSYYYPAAFLSTLGLNFIIYQKSPLTLSSQFWPIYLTSTLKAIGVIAFNKAIKLNMTKSIASASFTSLVAMFLSMIFLQEYQLFNPVTPAGRRNLIGLSFFIFFLLYSINLKSKETKQWAGYRLLSLILLGVNLFFVKWFTARQLAPATILSYEYAISGLFISITMLYQKRSFKLNKKLKMLSSLAGIFTSFSILALYTALSLAPVNKILPMRNVLTLLVYAPIGYLFFGERKILTKKERVGLVFGLSGALLLSF